MNLAILIGHFPPAAFGGAELQAEGWARRLAPRHRVTVVTRSDMAKPPGRETRDGFDVVRVPVSRVPGWRTLADRFEIERVVPALTPRPDVLLCFQTFISGWAGTHAGRRHGIPAVVWVRGEAEYQLSKHPLMRWLSPRVWGRAAGTIVQSASNRDELLAELARHAPQRVAWVRERLEVLGNGLDLPATTPLPAGGRVLSVGRLIADKGFDVVIDACARAGRPLTIAGEGPERASLAAHARRAGADVCFAGHADRGTLARLYEESAVVVLAARRGEGLPNVVLEAMAHARPVVATPCAGTRDLLVDGANGLVVPADDAAAIATALTRLATEPGLAARFASAGRSAVEPFAWERLVPRLEALLARWSRR